MRTPFHVMLILSLFVAVGCDNEPAAEPSDPKNGADTAATPEPDPEPEPKRPKLPPVGVCAHITSEEITRVTGQTYDTALSAAAYPELTHCEYRKDRHAIALLVASGEGAVQRMEKAKAGPRQTGRRIRRRRHVGFLPGNFCRHGRRALRRSHHFPQPRRPTETPRPRQDTRQHGSRQSPRDRGMI